MSHIEIQTFKAYDGGHFGVAAYVADDGRVDWGKAGFGVAASEGSSVVRAMADLEDRRERERAAAERPTLGLAEPAASGIPPADSSDSGGDDVGDWAAMSPRDRLYWAIKHNENVVVTYTSAELNKTTTREVKPLDFEGVGFRQKVALIDVEAGLPKRFFVSGITSVEKIA